MPHSENNQERRGGNQKCVGVIGWGRSPTTIWREQLGIGLCPQPCNCRKHQVVNHRHADREEQHEHAKPPTMGKEHKAGKESAACERDWLVSSKLDYHSHAKSPSVP